MTTAHAADRQGLPSSALHHALRAIELWRDEPVELASEPWAVASVEQCRLRFAAIAVRAGELLLARGDLDRVQDLADRALAVDPWLEAGHRLIVATHLARGDNLPARRALQRYRDAVHDLGVDPARRRGWSSASWRGCPSRPPPRRARVVPRSG
jgi:DNA-binding SARP family transcriptional activator